MCTSLLEIPCTNCLAIGDLDRLRIVDVQASALHIREVEEKGLRDREALSEWSGSGFNGVTIHTVASAEAYSIGQRPVV